VDTLAVAGRFDLTDEQWAALEPLLPAPSRPGRPSLWGKRQLINGIRWRVRTGAPWRDMPEAYGVLGSGVWAVPPLAAGGCLAGDPDRVAGAG
jgi:transposase